jgi:uncharacterized protein YlxW (UPF0749 family)
MSNLLIKLGLAFLLGVSVTFGALSYFKKLEMERLSQEVFDLERKNSALQERVRMLQLNLENIEKEVTDEQSNKKPNQITDYWNSAYRSSRKSK